MPTDATTLLPVISATTFANVVIFALLANYFVERWLLSRHLRWVAAFRDEVPEPFAGRITLEDHQRAADYTKAKGQVMQVEAGVGILVSGLILFGGLSRLWQVTAPLAGISVGREVALIALLSVVTGLIGIPFSYYNTFYVEEKFGFNKTTRATFWMDLVKGSVLSAALILPLAALVF